MKRNLLTILVFGVLLIALVGVMSLVVSAVVIGRSVDERCEQAQDSYGGDCVEALMVLVENEEESFRERNSSIWALGQLGDKRALLVLEQMYTGVILEREPYDAGISQYELKKAVSLVGGGFNITALVWR